MKRAFLLALGLFSFFQHTFAADNEAPELQTRYGHYYATYRLNADATHVETHDWTTKVLQERAVEGAKRISISYSTNIQKSEVLHAYTLKADGRRIEVPKSNYQLEVNSGKDQNAPVFSDITSLTVVFPDVAVGDTIAFAYKLTQVEAMFPGHFSVTNTLSKLVAYDDVKITMDLPSTLWFQAEARQMTEKRVEKDGRVILEWTFQNREPIKSKRLDWSVYDPEKEPGYTLSTFKSYAELADEYGLRARPKAAVTLRVQQLADEITKDKKTPREQAKVLYDWVATNITYAGNCIGVGAVVPHDLAFILDNRMGDCKDHATLLQALLAAKGIRNTQALINAGSIYKLPKIPVVATVNHVINYLPDLNLYADSTSQSTPFGMLPVSDIGKPVLLVDGFKEGTTTPSQPIGSNRQHIKSTVTFSSDGSLKGEIDVNLAGLFAVETRANVRHLSKDHEEEMLKSIFRNIGQGGSGKITKDDAKELLDNYHYRVTFESKELLQSPGPAALSIYPLFPTEAPIQRFLYNVAMPDETVDTVCFSGQSIEEYRYQFPKNIKILAVPKNMKLANDFLSYQANYQLKDHTLTVKRILDDKTPGHICSPAFASAYKKLAKEIAKNVQSQVIYQWLGSRKTSSAGTEGRQASSLPDFLQCRA